jgi:hypothetical protein
MSGNRALVWVCLRPLAWRGFVPVRSSCGYRRSWACWSRLTLPSAREFAGCISADDAVSQEPAAFVIGALQPALEPESVPGDPAGVTVVQDEDPDWMWRPRACDEGIALLFGGPNWRPCEGRVSRRLPGAGAYRVRADEHDTGSLATVPAVTVACIMLVR